MIATNTAVECKGDSIPYTSLNGHMFSMFTKAGQVALRLPEEERKKFLKKYNTNLLEQYGIVQKEYVVVPDDLLKDTAALKRFFNISVQYVSELKPKLVGKSKKKEKSG